MKSTCPCIHRAFPLSGPSIVLGNCPVTRPATSPGRSCPSTLHCTRLSHVPGRFPESSCRALRDDSVTHCLPLVSSSQPGRPTSVLALTLRYHSQRRCSSRRATSSCRRTRSHTLRRPSNLPPLLAFTTGLRTSSFVSMAEEHEEDDPPEAGAAFSGDSTPPDDDTGTALLP